MHETVADRVRDGGFSDRLMPALRRDLGGDDRRTVAIPIFEYFEQVSALRIFHGSNQEVIEHQDVCLRELIEKFGIGAIGSSD